MIGDLNIGYLLVFVETWKLCNSVSYCINIYILTNWPAMELILVTIMKKKKKKYNLLALSYSLLILITQIDSSTTMTLIMYNNEFKINLSTSFCGATKKNCIIKIIIILIAIIFFRFNKLKIIISQQVEAFD